MNKMAVSKAAPVSPEVAEKLEKGWRYVTIPEKDLYNYKFGSVWVNQDEYKPGTHLVHPDVADTIEERLRVREIADRRLLRPDRDEKSVEQATNRGASIG
jgi:hypothetical protein